MELLERAFETLQTKAIVSDALQQEYERAVAVMRGLGARQERISPARELQAKVEQMLRDPMGFVD